MPKTTIPALTREEAMRIFHQDGIIEIITGAVLINFGFDLLNQSSRITSLFTYIPIILLSSMKNQVSISRLGYDAFGGDEKKVRFWNLAIAAGLVVMLLLMSTTVLDDPLKIRTALTLPFGGDIRNLFAGTIMALACLAAGYFIPLKRFFYYAPVPFVAGLISFFFFPAYVPVFFCAVAILVPGIRLMVKFTRAYPLNKVKK
ncbi:MAG: hypothetical protein Q8N39_04385 [Pelolinea sp.]|nr:hypothetical protein [Pelolinea sp.]